ncbi:ABC transporter substrate-binding protein, partial [bacterium]|nr:ABC transporter substrate-binding protein [bacterium]
MNRRQLILVLLLLAGCGPAGDGRVRIVYWEKWSGAEAAAMQAVVDQFNRSQDRIVVEFLSTSNVDRKTIVATAGGDPPDVAGLWPANVYSFVDRDALVPLDDLVRTEGYTPEQWQARYYPVYADLCSYRGRIWAVPTAASATALHWNKQLFREAGLDPDRPPRTLAELDAFADKLTRRDPRTGAITQLGFLPQEPGWFAWAFPAWFGGGYVDGDTIDIGTRPENLAAYEWVAGYTRRYGLDQIRAFTGGFGNFASPQNPFFSGRIAMVIQGVWMNNFIRQFAPGLEYGVAPWPATRPGLENFTVAESDVLAIPRGSKHPRAAWEFIKFVSSVNPRAASREELLGLELLCWLQQKNSPLREWSPHFERHHPHPYINLFRGLAESPNAIHLPKIGIWQEYRRELDALFGNVRLLTQPPDQALAFCQRRVAASWHWHQRSLARRARDVSAVGQASRLSALPTVEPGLDRLEACPTWSGRMPDPPGLA